jgi:hypothetical protein
MSQLHDILRRIGALPVQQEPQLRDLLVEAEAEADMQQAGRIVALDRLCEAREIVDAAAAQCGYLDHPSHAFVLLTEDEQRRIYTLLSGEAI